MLRVAPEIAKSEQKFKDLGLNGASLLFTSNKQNKNKKVNNKIS